MIKDKCNHEWVMFLPTIGNTPAKYECKNCNVWLTASDVYQLETLNHLRGFEMWLSIIAVVFSFIALFISIFK